MIGRDISHYRVLEALGAGGMGVVYLAQDGRLGRQVALKFLPPEASRDETTLERFRIEARAASSLSHPGICTVFDIGDDGGSPFIVMEALKGETLRDRIKRAPIKVTDVLDLAIQLADALDAAHSQGIVHRDIKPGNIFVGDKNRVKILDFGLAKLVQPLRTGPDGQTTATMMDDQLTLPGSTLGTVSYMSPEQARGEEVDARSDLFSLGTVIYEMAAGTQAFGGSSPGAVIAAILIRPPAPLVERNASIPARLEEIIQRALEKDRDLRYQHAADLQADLKRLRRDLELNSSMSATRLDGPYGPASAGPMSAARASVARTSAAGASRVPHPAAAASVAPASAQAASHASAAPPAPSGGSQVWRYGLVAGAVAVVIALGVPWVWHLRQEAPAAQVAPSPAASPAAASAAPSAASQPEAASTPSPLPTVEPAAVPPTSAAPVQAEPRMQPAPSRPYVPQPAAPSATRSAQVASPAVTEAPAPPPPQVAPATQGPLLSGVPLANGGVPTPPPPSAPATRPAPPPASPAQAAQPAAAETDDAAIRRTLATYASAIEKKDVSLFRAVRPALSAAEEARLRESFQQIESQQVTLTVDEIHVDGRTATVRLSRKDSLVVRGRTQTQNIRQVVRLEKSGAGWIIAEFR